MRKTSLVVSDVDGTLLTRDKVLTPRAIAAVRRLHESGIAFSLCSSRPPFGMRMLIEPLALQLPIGGYNAGAIVDPGDLAIIEQRVIAPATAGQAVDIFHGLGIECWLFTGNHWLVTNRHGPHVDHEIRTVQTPPTVVAAFEEAHFAAIGKIVGPSDDHDLVGRCITAMREALAGRASVARSQPYYCDVMAEGTRKGRLVTLLATQLKIPRTEIVVLGDMENDLDMFGEAGFAIAMGNASSAVQRAAQATTLSNEEDGFALAIERYVLAG